MSQTNEIAMHLIDSTGCPKIAGIIVITAVIITSITVMTV